MNVNKIYKMMTLTSTHHTSTSHIYYIHLHNAHKPNSYMYILSTFNHIMNQ